MIHLGIQSGCNLECVLRQKYSAHAGDTGLARDATELLVMVAVVVLHFRKVLSSHFPAMYTVQARLLSQDGRTKEAHTLLRGAQYTHAFSPTLLAHHRLVCIVLVDRLCSPRH